MEKKKQATSRRYDEAVIHLQLHCIQAGIMENFESGMFWTDPDPALTLLTV